jgi:hypothetical protein
METLRLQLENGLNRVTREAYAKIGRPEATGEEASQTPGQKAGIEAADG